jgi:hypothetical protein
VSRVSFKSQQGLAIRSYHQGALLLPIVFDGVPAKQAKVGFEHVGDKYFLSTIETQRASIRWGHLDP